MGSKHVELTKPERGTFGRVEVAIYGTSCADVEQLAQRIAACLPGKKIAYVDGIHRSADAHDKTGNPFFSHLRLGEESYTFHRQERVLEVEWRRPLDEADLVLVNGNHFAAQAQIIVTDSRKWESLRKRKEQLTRVLCILQKDEDYPMDELFSDLLQGRSDIPIYPLKDDEAWIPCIEQFLHLHTPMLNGLVLVGGKSRRMGFDKSTIQKGGLPIREYLYTLLYAHVEEVYFSIRPDQVSAFDGKEVLDDRFVGLGPMGGILTAFMHNPNRAWLVVATDLLGLDREALEYLIAHRNPSAVATAFVNPVTQMPDPLCTIWEPRAYGYLLEFLRQGHSCPRKVLLNTDVQLVQPQSEGWLFNANTPGDLQLFYSHSFD